MSFFKLQNYNEFNSWMRWHDYFSIMINEFPVILIRRYDWLEGTGESYTFLVQFMGFHIYGKTKYDTETATLGFAKKFFGLIMGLFLLVSVTSYAHASTQLKVTVPSTVTEIKSINFSSGSGEDYFMMVYVFCVDNGREVLYIGKYLSPGRYMRFG